MTDLSPVYTKCRTPSAEHRRLTEDLPMNLKLSNRPVRTRMPGGVAGVPPTGGPLCRLSPRSNQNQGCDNPQQPYKVAKPIFANATRVFDDNYLGRLTTTMLAG
jgi:hypothetical protein